MKKALIQKDESHALVVPPIFFLRRPVSYAAYRTAKELQR